MTFKIKLRELTEDDHPFGNEQGRLVRNKLQLLIEKHLSETIYEVSLEGIKATDASFPRESVFSLVKQLKGERWFFLSHFSSDDLVDNWDYAARAKDIQLVVKNVEV